MEKTGYKSIDILEVLTYIWLLETIYTCDFMY